MLDFDPLQGFHEGDQKTDFILRALQFCQYIAVFEIPAETRLPANFVADNNTWEVSLQFLVLIIRFAAGKGKGFLFLFRNRFRKFDNFSVALCGKKGKPVGGGERNG